MSILKGSWQHSDITSNGLKLHYVTQGNGPLMLMLHGFPEFWYSWRHQIPEFAKDFKVVALDLRGYNDSDKPPDLAAYRVSELINDVRGVIQGLGYESCILVAHDWGGAIAWSFADTYPEMVERLIITNMPHPAKLAEGLHNPQQLLRSWYMFFFQLPWLPEIVFEWSNYQAIELVFLSQVVNKSAFSEVDIAAYKQAAAKPGALTAMLNYYRNAFEGLINREWGVIKIPTLMIWGEKDIAFSKELTFGMEAYVNDFRIRYIPECSHWVQEEQPQLVNQYMREFLQYSFPTRPSR